MEKRMISSMGEIRIKTLTPLWTGDIDRDCKRIKETGIIGSLRWWYEALVRGMGGYACDPTSGGKCELNQDKFDKAIKSGKTVQEALDEQICPSCQLFGCTGWKKMFRVEVSGLTTSDFILGRGQKSGLQANKEIFFNYTFLYEKDQKHKWLFKKTLWIIENYGAIGGRTTWKPNSSWGTPYGIIKIEDYGEIKYWNSGLNKEDIENWLGKNKKSIGRDNDADWFDFRFYWIVEGKYLNRLQMNKIVSRGESGNYTQTANDFDRWLGGRIGESKKIFSFERPAKKVFGYVKNEEGIDKIKERLQLQLGKETNFKTGKEILET